MDARLRMTGGRAPPRPRRGRAAERSGLAARRSGGDGPAILGALEADTYLTAYRHFARLLAAGRACPGPSDLTGEALLDFRDGLEAAPRARSTAPRSSRPCRLAAASLETEDADSAGGGDRPEGAEGAHMARARAPARHARPPHARRDLAILLLLGQVGLRRSEVCALRYEDLEELRRHPTRDAAVAPRAVKRSAWVVHARHPNPGVVDLPPTPSKPCGLDPEPPRGVNAHCLRLARWHRDPSPCCPGAQQAPDRPTTSGWPARGRPHSACAPPHPLHSDRRARPQP